MVAVQPDPDDHARLLGVGEQQGGVLGGRSGLEPRLAARPCARTSRAIIGGSPVRRTTTSRAARSVAAFAQVVRGVDHHHVAGRPARSSASAGGPTADEDGALLAHEPRTPASSPRGRTSRADHDDRAALDRGAQRGQAAAVQEQVLLAAEELGAVVGERLELGHQPLRACSICRRPRPRRARGRCATSASPT